MRNVWMYEERVNLAAADRTVRPNPDGSLSVNSTLIPDLRALSERSDDCSRWSLFALQVLDALDDYDPFDGTGSEPVFISPHTPEILLRLGLNDLPVAINRYHVYTALAPKDSADPVVPHPHGLGLDRLFRLPELLERPCLVADSVSRDDSLLAVLPMLDPDGLPVIVPICPQPGSRVMTINLDYVNQVSSVYGKRNWHRYFGGALAAEDVLWIDDGQYRRLGSLLTDAGYPGNGADGPFPAYSDLPRGTVIRRARASRHLGDVPGGEAFAGIAANIMRDAAKKHSHAYRSR